MTQYQWVQFVRVSQVTHDALLARVAETPNETKSGFIRKAIQAALAADTQKGLEVAPSKPSENNTNRADQDAFINAYRPL